MTNQCFYKKLEYASSNKRFLIWHEKFWHLFPSFPNIAKKLKSGSNPMYTFSYKSYPYKRNHFRQLSKEFYCLRTVIGYVASAGHGIAAAVSGKDEDLQRARRACAASTKSTLVTAGAIGGGLVGGPAGM